MVLLLLSDVSLFIGNYKGVNEENVMRRPYFSPFALPSIIHSVYHRCKKTDMTDIWIILITLLTDTAVTIMVIVYCTSEEEDCKLSASIVIPISCMMVQFIGRLSICFCYIQRKMRARRKEVSEEARRVTYHNPRIHTLKAQKETSQESFGLKTGRVAPLNLNTRLKMATDTHDAPQLQKQPIVPPIKQTL